MSTHGLLYALRNASRQRLTPNAQGTREIGLIEFPMAVTANRVETQFPIITMDLMAGRTPP